MPPTAKSNPARTRGVAVELHSGDTVHVRPWGWDHFEQNAAVLADIGRDVIAAWDKAEEGEIDPDALREIVTRNLRKVRGLIAASLTGGDDDVDKLGGLLDIVNVIDAVIDTNGIMEALAKVQARVRAIRSSQTHPAR